MVAPFAGGSPPEGQGNWNPNNGYQQQAQQQQQGRQQQPPGRYEPHALSQPPQDSRGPPNPRQMYSNTPPPDMTPQHYPYQDPAPTMQQTIPSTDRQMRDLDLLPPVGPPAERQKTSSTNGSRRPSGSRVCGKCGEPLAGQFVRALDSTFHLECFTCQVRDIKIERQVLLDHANTIRNVAKSSRLSSSLFLMKAQINIPFVKPIISSDWISYAINAKALFVAPTSLRSTGNTTLSILLAPCVQPFLGHRTAITSTKAMYTAITTTLQSLRSAVLVAKTQF
jgi:hypothetical protein